MGPDKPYKTYDIRLVRKACSLVVITFNYEEIVFIDNEKGERVMRVLQSVQNDELIVKCNNDNEAQRLKEMLSQYRV